MNILISGSSGLVGTELAKVLELAQHRIGRLVRRKPAAGDDVFWDPSKGELDPQRLADVDAVVHLAGESIAAGRWTAKQKEKVLKSRTEGTKLISEALAKAPPRQRVLVCASAIGYYGNRGDEVLDESSASGQGDFLSQVCRAWEAATEPAARAGVRVVNTRFGIVLSDRGGALKKMLLPFKLGVGGKIGSGQQWMSWVAIDDVVWSIADALKIDSLAGPVNVVSPNPVTNAEFTKTLGRVLKRPTIFPMPAFAARLAFGQMGEELLLGSQRVLPKRLQAAGYQFKFPQLESALQHVLSQPINKPF